jgi:tRNA modification GTPase
VSDAAHHTIVALSTAPGPAGIAILRLSGPAAGTVLEEMAGVLPLAGEARRARLARLCAPGSGEAIDQALVLWFPGPRSFSGEDMAELHVHGGEAVVSACLGAALALDGVRLAEPGEFSRRAFINGKLDLTEAEGLADLVGAETEAQRRQALRQLDGALGRQYGAWRERLVGALAHVEAALDFADEALPDDLLAKAAPAVAGVGREIAAHLDDGRRGERLRSGLAVAVVGPPNAGKSSIINQLTNRDVAIVSPAAGTTRDVIEVHLDLGGVAVVVADTAGLRDGGDAIEAEGVRRARARAAAADLVVAVFDATTVGGLDEDALSLVGSDGLVVLNKADLVAGALPSRVAGHVAVATSCVSGDGIAALVSAIAKTVGSVAGEGAPLTRARHRAALSECLASLERFGEAAAPELAAEDLRQAMRSLGRIIGRVDVEDILDAIFAEFCIGK